MREQKKRKIIIGALCGVVLLMIVGYAAFSSLLNISGTAGIKGQWNIEITEITSKVVNGNPTDVSTSIGENKLSASFETKLLAPGDVIEYNIKVENKGNINATLTSVEPTELKSTNPAIEITKSGLEVGNDLPANTEKVLTIQVKYLDVTELKSTENTTFTISLQFSQAGTTGGGNLGGQTINVKGIDIPVMEEGSNLDGLYADVYETGRYVYKGTNPSNYITFNGEEAGWRIISVETDGTLKIMKKESIMNEEFDVSPKNNWARPATLNRYLNNDGIGKEYYWPTLNSDAKELIQEHAWGIGAVTPSNTDLAAQIASENGTTWTGNIGLISLSDFLRANTNMTQCANSNDNILNHEICKTTNYLVPSSGQMWTISPREGYVAHEFYVDYYGNESTTLTNSSYDVFPTLYLIPNITLSGEGTSDNPYTITKN